MKLWMSGEIMSDVADLYRECRKTVEKKINDLMCDEAILPDIEEWAYIAIIRDKDHPDYDEVFKKTSKGKVMEFRLKVSHEDFVSGSNSDRIALILESLGRSVDHMSLLGGASDGQERLREILHSARSDLIGNP